MFMLALASLVSSAHADIADLPTKDSILGFLDREEKTCTQRGLDILYMLDQTSFYYDQYVSSRGLVRTHSGLAMRAWANATCRGVEQAYAAGCAAEVPLEAAEFCD